MAVEFTSHGTQCLDQVRKIICNMGLPRIDREEVQVRKKPWNREVIYQGCTIWATKEIYAAGTNERDDVGYGCVITFAAYDSQDMSSNLDQIPIWISAVRNKFNFLGRLDITLRKQCSFGIINVSDFNTKPPAQHPDAGKYELESLLVRAWIREARAS